MEKSKLAETVSLCVVAYNEEKFLPSLLEDLSLQTYPHEKTEVILIDSHSGDRTRAIMESYAAENKAGFSKIQVLENPRRIQAAGWNVAIANARMDIIIRIDAHAHIPQDFTALNVRNIQSGEYISGGCRPCLTEHNSRWGNLLLQTENSLFGSSIGKSRRSHKKEYVNSLFHGAYRREVFEKVGGFNETLLRTEDNELHYRMRKAGFRFAFDPQIISYQYARGSFSKMIRQKYGNGYWIGLTLGVCPGCISPYHLVPFLFTGAILVTGLLAVLGSVFCAAALWSLYLIFVAAGTICTITQQGFDPLFLLMPVLFLILHVSYGIGTLAGLIQMPRWRKTKYREAGPVYSAVSES